MSTSEFRSISAPAEVYEPLRRCLASVQTALLGNPNSEKREVDEAERMATRTRDALIACLRSAEPGAAADWRRLLDRMNVAISLIVSVEYPGKGAQRIWLEQSVGVLTDVLASINIDSTG